MAGTNVITQHGHGWLLRHVKSRDELPVCFISFKYLFFKCSTFLPASQHGKKKNVAEAKRITYSLKVHTRAYARPQLIAWCVFVIQSFYRIKNVLFFFLLF